MEKKPARRWAAAAALLAACAATKPAATPDPAAGGDPRSLQALRGRIEAARKRGALAPVAADLEEATRAHPGEASAWYGLGLVRFAQKREAEAAAALLRAAELEPGDADIQYRSGVALLDGGRLAAARVPLARAVELAPRVARYRIPLAGCLDRLGARGGALDALRSVPDLSPSAAEAALAVAVARTLTDPFRDVPAAARPYLEAGMGYLAIDAPGLALQPLESLAETFPDLAAAHALLGLAAQRLDQSARAASELARAAQLAPALPQPHSWLGEMYESKERWDLAATEYAAALERNPLDPATLRRLGLLLLERLGQPAAAIEPFRRAAALAPLDSDLQLLLARAQVAGRTNASR
jgi:tetratricopeptide (TPR) repeat protein